jgi:hypothetical protein
MSEPQVLSLTNVKAFLRKVSNNLLNRGDEKVTAFTLPMSEVALDRKALNELLGARTFEAWFEQRKDGSWHPMPYWMLRKDGSFALDVEYDTAGVEISGGGRAPIVFEGEEAESEKGEDTPAGRVSNIVLTPQPGGMTLLAFHLQVCPGVGRENLALQQLQYHHLVLTLGETCVVVREKQRDFVEESKGKSGEATAAH